METSFENEGVQDSPHPPRMCHFFFLNVYLFLRERETEWEWETEREREGDTESEVGSRL